LSITVYQSMSHLSLFVHRESVGDESPTLNIIEPNNHAEIDTI